MNTSEVATDPARGPVIGERAARPGSDAGPAVFAGVLAVLLATGWSANHFAALIPAISAQQHLSAATLDAMFGAYAVGLLPGLLVGGGCPIPGDTGQWRGRGRQSRRQARWRCCARNNPARC